MTTHYLQLALYEHRRREQQHTRRSSLRIAMFGRRHEEARLRGQ